jgi:Cys-tRNA(Pro)/Cys-tRNA(Cys) deacylase
VAGRGTPATIALQRAGIPFTVHEYAHDPRHSSYGLEASQALGIPPERVFKTLIAEVDGNLVTGIVPAGGRRGLEIELAPADLVRAAGATVASIGSPG